MAGDFRKAADPKGMAELERGYAVPDSVVLDSACCSMGRVIALRATGVAGWEMHDTNSLLGLVGELGVTAADVDAFEARPLRPTPTLWPSLPLRSSSASRPPSALRPSVRSRWGEAATYDLMLNADVLGRDLASGLLVRLMLG